MISITSLFYLFLSIHAVPVGKVCENVNNETVVYIFFIKKGMQEAFSLQFAKIIVYVNSML